MTTIDNLRTLKQQLQRQKEGASKDQSEWIDGELSKIEIALSLLDEGVHRPARRDTQKPPLA